MVPGADVSHFRVVTDWTALQGAVRLLGIKATDVNTDGSMNMDRVLIQHRDGFRASTLDLAIYYHVARAGDPAEQAKHLAAAVGPLQRNERLCLDLERSRGRFSLAFLETFFYTLGLSDDPLIETRPMIYVSAGGWSDNIGATTWDTAKYLDLWMPRYAAEPGPLPAPWMPDPTSPQPWQKLAAWQHTDQAAIPGITLPCDGNFFMGTQAELEAFAA